MLKKYKTWDEAAKDLPFFLRKLRKKGSGNAFMEVPFMGISYPQGIRKFRTMEEANEEREEWILKRSLKLSAKLSKKKG